MQEQTIQMQPEAYVAGQGGAVDSVNGQTGDVVLTTSDLENTSDYQTGTEVANAVAAEAEIRSNADIGLQGQIDALAASSDVTDIVGTYADLQAYDTTHLKDNDIIKVLQDESQNDETTYYRWSTSTETFTLIGEEGPYYTKSAVDTLLNAKQNTLTAGSNISISGSTISATDTTYSNFTGTDGTAAGTAGLVPAPATTDAGKFLKADGTWDTAGSAINVVQTTGTSTTDVMSQNATTSMVFANPGTNDKIRIGQGSNVTGNYGIAIGGTSSVTVTRGVAIGYNATATGAGYDSVVIGRGTSATANSSVAIGSWSTASTVGVVSVGNTARTDLYNGTGYRKITNVYDGQSAHDAATYGQVISYSAINGAGAPTTATEGKYVGQLYYDTTNEAMYFLKAIDTTTTPATYTWEALGGGSSVNVVQTTGTSQTDVMSQNAVTSMVFADPGTNSKVRIGTTTTGSGAVSIGQYCTSSGSQSVAIGSGAKTTYDYSVAIGSSATVRNKSRGGICIGEVNGSTNGVMNNYGIAIGSFVGANGVGSVSLGSGSVTGGDAGVALGYNGQANAAGSVAIGSYSSASSVGEMNIGSSNTSYGYNSSNYRLLSGVYDGQSDHDATTVGQLNSRVIGSLTSAPTTSTAGAVGALVATVESGTGHLYICTDDTGGTYTWQLLA